MEQKGVSPVVGTILLIAITVALAAVVATLVSGLGGRGTPPSAMLRVTAEENTSTRLKLTISHEGGDDLILSDLKVNAGKSGTTLGENANIGSGTFSVGKTQIVYIDATFTKGDAITVYVIHVPSKQKIFDSRTVVVQ